MSRKTYSLREISKQNDYLYSFFFFIFILYCSIGPNGKESPCLAKDTGLIPGSGRSPAKGKPTPIILPGKSHRQEPGGLQSMGSQRVGHDLVAKPQQHCDLQYCECQLYSKVIRLYICIHLQTYTYIFSFSDSFPIQFITEY